MLSRNTKIIVPGAAGLVGQNLIVMLKEQGYHNIVAIDQHEYNVNMLRELHPDVEIILANLSQSGIWEESFRDAEVLIMLQAQITSKTREPFVKNNITSTRLVLDSARKHNIPYIVHISSSVVISVADDDYTDTKKTQEQMIIESGFKYCVVRPTLMFGWFDKKHLGWLSRFMKKVPIFPIPGDGKYLRQPLYVRDFCSVIIKCMELQPDNRIYNITGKENIDYIDIIKTIKRIKKFNTIILPIPISLFYFLLRFYAIFSKKPPFTADQLKALTAGDKFPSFSWWDEFNVTPTPFEIAMNETHTDPRYSRYILKP